MPGGGAWPGRPGAQPESQADTALPVEPGILQTPAVVVAVDHHRVALELVLPARRGYRIEDRRTGAVLGQPAFDLPDDPEPLVAIALHRLLVDQLFDLGVAVPGIVALGAAREILIELLVR